MERSASVRDKFIRKKKGIQMNTKGYCLRCKTKRIIENGGEVVMKNNMYAIKGKCGVCATTIFKITGKKK